MRSFLLLASVLGVSAIAFDANAQTAGINMGAPVWKGVVAVDAMKAAVSTGAAHVRVNFRLDQWTSPNDPGFFAAYDQIVDGITSEGLEVYGLLSDELAPELGDQYVAFATAVIDHYKDRVRVWETINEPNDWAGGTSARISPSTFADLHGRLYSAVKVAHAGDACWDVKLVTGPLFSFDGNSSASYLADAIAAGRAGGGWKAVRDATGKDPIDGVGYHLYVAQGKDSSESDVGASAAANLDALRNVLAARGLGDQKVWVSEVGYQAELLGDQGQATRLDTTFAALGARSDVASIQWFTIGDFGGLGWGVFKETGFAASDRRPAFESLKAQAKTHAPDLAAKLVVELPKKSEIGKPVVAKLTATNLGKRTWTSDAMRFGAASGCPSAWSINEWAWSPAASDGYAKSLTDARRFLPSGKSVAQGESITVDVPLATPTALGKQHFAARMVEEGVAWFGATASGDVEIVPASTPTSPGDDANASDGTSGPNAGARDGHDDGGGAFVEPRGCACREAPSRSDASAAARGASFAAVLVGLALLARRRFVRR